MDGVSGRIVAHIPSSKCAQDLAWFGQTYVQSQLLGTLAHSVTYTPCNSPAHREAAHHSPLHMRTATTQEALRINASPTMDIPTSKYSLIAAATRFRGSSTHLIRNFKSRAVIKMDGVSGRMVAPTQS